MDTKSIVQDTEAVTRKILADNNISIVDIPQVSLKELVSMSVNKIKPFEEKGEKGFRD